MERERWLCSSYDRRSTIEQEAGLPLHVLRFQYVARNLCCDEHTHTHTHGIRPVGRLECREQMQPNDNNTLRIESVQQLQHAFT